MLAAAGGVAVATAGSDGEDELAHPGTVAGDAGVLGTEVADDDDSDDDRVSTPGEGKAT
ncbi:hypothetical protein [Blastococcus sp. SYSU DS0539]